MKLIIAFFLFLIYSQFSHGQEIEIGLSQEVAFIKQHRIAKLDFLNVPLREMVDFINKEIRNGQKVLGVEKEKILIVKFDNRMDSKAREQTVYVALKNTSLEVLFGVIFDQTSITYRIERGAFVLTKNAVE